MADVHPSWLCNDCIAEGRKDCALADPDVVSESARCWEPLPAGTDLTLPAPAPELSPDLVLLEHSYSTECELCDGVCDFLGRESASFTVRTEDIPDAVSDFDHALAQTQALLSASGGELSSLIQKAMAHRHVEYTVGVDLGRADDDIVIVPAPSPDRKLPTVGDILNTPHARAQREQRDEQVRRVAERLGWSYREEAATRDTVARYTRELGTALASQWRAEDASLRLIDLSRVEGKTQEEIAELIRARHENHWHIDARPKEAKVDIVSALGRGARFGAALALGLGLGWAAADRVWSRWR